jgi:alkanesulfonate monooxygenase SsuD/methylene tetrahydromethanopterin reductase-like flavin-dependent oxidoreductase (luciferase family)
MAIAAPLARTAEGAGWEGAFVWDHVAYRERGWPVADPYVVVAAVAEATEHMRIGVLVSALPRRRPWKMAREMASLDFAFRRTPSRARKLDESLEIITGL